MNGELGRYLIKPDQMILLNPGLVLLLIPLFEEVIYPFFAKFGFNNLHRITIGGLLAALAFVVAGVLELNLQGPIL